jgi:hypothetical protein
MNAGASLPARRTLDRSQQAQASERLEALLGQNPQAATFRNANARSRPRHSRPSFHRGILGGTPAAIAAQRGVRWGETNEVKNALQVR